MKRYKIKRGDLFPVLRTNLTDEDGAFVDISTATAVRCLVRRSGSAVTIINKPATVNDAATGDVEYAWAAGETDTVGRFLAEFEVEWPEGPETFPNDDREPYIAIDIAEDLG